MRRMRRRDVRERGESWMRVKGGKGSREYGLRSRRKKA